MEKVKLYSKYVALLCLAASPIVVSCSDDDEPQKPSREIVKVEIYKAEESNYQHVAQYKFSYDEKNRIESVTTDFKSQNVNYDYSASLAKYNWNGNDANQGGTFVNRFEATLRNGRVQAGSMVHSAGVGNTDTTFVYNYHYTSGGYIQDASFAGSVPSFIINYEWGKSSLSLKCNLPKYNDTYTYSTVPNDYSFDLNVLPMLVDSRTNLMLEQNVYAQLAGLLGNRYPMFLQDEDYTYNYHYDADGRLVLIEQKHASLTPGKQADYWFMITYSEY